MPCGAHPASDHPPPRPPRPSRVMTSVSSGPSRSPHLPGAQRHETVCERGHGSAGRRFSTRRCGVIVDAIGNRTDAAEGSAPWVGCEFSWCSPSPWAGGAGTVYSFRTRSVLAVARPQGQYGNEYTVPRSQPKPAPPNLVNRSTHTTARRSQ